MAAAVHLLHLPAYLRPERMLPKKNALQKRMRSLPISCYKSPGLSDHCASAAPASLRPPASSSKRSSCCCGAFAPAATMQNEEGTMVDLYVPRKCSATNRIITAKDHASVQINIGHVDENGLYDGRFSTFALSGFVRAQGDADGSLDRLWQKRKAEIKQ